MKIKTLLIDDEKNAIKTLEILIGRNCPDLEIIGSASSVDDAILMIRKHKPDLIFLDIEMPSGSGFEVVENTSDCNYKIIFTTAYEQYAHQAFRVNAADYLLKPIDEHELLEAITKIRKKESVMVDLSSLSDLLQKPMSGKVNIPTSDGFILVNCDEIIRLESDSNYTWIHFTQQGKQLITKTLKDLEKQFEKFNFIRVHHSHLVNQRYISKIIKSDGGFIIMEDGFKIPISRRKKADILNLFN